MRIRLIVSSESTSEFSFEKISDALQIGVPHRSWHKGDKISDRVERVRPNNAMIYKYLTERDCDPIDGINSLLTLLEARGESAKIIFEANEGEIAIAIRLYAQDTPPMHLGASVLRRLAALNVSVDFDLYVMPEE